MKRFGTRYVGLRFGLLVGLIGLIQIAAVAVPMYNNRDAIFTLQRTEAASEKCFTDHQAAPNLYTGDVNTCPLAVATPPVDEIANDVRLAYALSLPPLFILYFLAGRASGRALRRKRSVPAALQAALIGGAIYIVANTIRSIALFSPFAVIGQIDAGSPYIVSLNDELATLVLFLALLCLCALVLGFLGSRSLLANTVEVR